MKNSNIRISNLIFYLLILFLPTQFGRHFWFDFSLVSGVRVDYLSPTLFLTDILILFLFIVWFIGVCHRERSVAISLGLLRHQMIWLLAMTTHLKYWKLLVFLVFLIFGIFMSKNQPAGIYGFIKLLEFIFLGFYTAGNIKRLNFGIVLLLFSIGIIFESLLAILQYFNQGSIGGIFYFFGERTFNGQTPGIANASVGGEFILRPYGTFSHPNVLAGYLIIAMTVISNINPFDKLRVDAERSPAPSGAGRSRSIKNQISNMRKVIFAASLTIGTIALFMTMSRLAIVLWFIIVGFQGITYSIKKLRNAKPMIHNSSFIIRLLVVLVFIGSIFLLSPLRFRFTQIKLTDESIVVRQELIKSSFLMIKDNPLFGVGLNNFLVELPNYQKIKNYFIDLQPAHNIYLLILSQNGIAGLAFFVWFIGKTYQNVKCQSFDRLRIDPERSRMGQMSNVKSMSKNLKSKKNNYLVISNWSLVISLSSILILGLFDHYFLTLQQGQLLFSFILGLCWVEKTR